MSVELSQARDVELERARSLALLPAGLDGRDETLVSPVHPSGARADGRITVPGTKMPDADDVRAGQGRRG
jgi:hypothetical protein